MILINSVAQDRMGMISRYGSSSVPMSIGILAGYLLAKGKQVRVVDELINPIEKCFGDIDNFLKDLSKPYIFGISCLTINAGRSYKIAKLLKDRYPGAKIILGGIHVTALPEEALTNEDVDIVVRGEGEETLVLLYDAIKDNKDYSHIAGISFKKDGIIIHNPDRPLIHDLDIIPRFPYELFNENKKYNIGFALSSRGCPYNCVFCSQKVISGRLHRFMSRESVIETLDLLINKYNQYDIGFFDDNFLVNKERVKLLCESIVQNRLNVKARFSCQARADNVDKEVLNYLKAAGFSSIGLGMETGSERLMKILNKGETVKDNIIAVKLMQSMGFDVSCYFLFGIPSETKEERFETYQIAKELKLVYAKFNNIVPYPATALLEVAKKEGTLNISKNWENFNSVGGVVNGIFSKAKLPYIPINTTEKELKRDLVRANLCFYLWHLPSLFMPKRGNPNWFILPEKWYFKPKELFYLLIMATKVALNCLIVFDMNWFIKGLFGKRLTKQLLKNNEIRF